MRTEELFDFIWARQSILLRRMAGVKPWTNDPILKAYRFCNVYREDDRVTKWIAANWRTPHKIDPNLWFAMVVARLFNNPNTLFNIDYPVPFSPERIKDAVEQMKFREMRIFNPAYIVSTNGVSMDKVDYLLERVLTPLWIDREVIRPKDEDTLESFAKRLIRYDGFAGFMVGQVVADMKYVPPLMLAKDWYSFALSGPGSRRGLNRVFDFQVDGSWSERSWHAKLMLLQSEIHLLQAKRGQVMTPLHAQDLQNCLCEWDKYERVRLGQGTPKQRYTPYDQKH